MKKKLIALTLAIVFVLSLSTGVSAQTSSSLSKTKGVKFEHSAPMKPADASSLSGKTVPLRTQTYITKDDSSVGEKIENNIDVLDSGIGFFAISNAIPLKTKNRKSGNAMLEANIAQANTYQTFTVNGTFQSQGQSAYVGPINLQSGQICQAQLDEPIKDSSNYYLIMYEMDSSQNLTAVDTSTYSSNNVPDAVGVVNRTSAAKTYYIRVFANQMVNSSASFTVHLSLGIDYDDTEANENAFTATQYANNVEADKDAYYLSGAELNSPYDNDWYDLYIPNTTDFTSISINSINESKAIISNTVKFEVYTANGSVLTKQPTNGNAFAIKSGHNYLRISTLSQDNFSPVIYNFSITPNRFADHSTYVVLMNGEPLPIQTYYVGGQRYALLTGSTLEWKVTYFSPSGYRANAAVDRISAEIYDKHWDPTADGCYYVSSYANAVDGVADLTLKAPPVFGANRGVSGMCYDSYVSLTLNSSLFGTEYDSWIFITSRIMS